MNDRFSAQIRQHLLDVANERPTDGQLAVLQAELAVTPQRHPLVARLTSFAGGIGPFPSAVLRLGLVAAIVAAVGGGALLVASGSGSPFKGTWTTIDTADGSTLSLTIGGGDTPHLLFEDDYGTGAACRDLANRHFVAEGAGVITGTRLEATFPNGGGCGGTVVDVGPYVLDFDAATGTLSDADNGTWTKRRDGEVPPTRAPTPTPVPTAEPTAEPSAPPPTVAPSLDPSCVQLDGQTRYMGNAGSLPFSVDVPATASEPWSGGRGAFQLTNEGCGGTGTVRFDALLVGHVYEDSCHWKDSSVDAPTAFDAANQLAAQQGHDTSAPIDTKLGPFRATRIDVSLPSGTDTIGCDEGILRLGGGGPNRDEVVIDLGETVQVYVAEVDGSTVVVTVTYQTDSATPALLAQIDAIVASLRAEF